MQTDIDRFINWVRMRNPQARTWRDYKCDLDLYMNVMANRGVEEIRPRDVDDFVNYQVNRGYKSSTVNRRLAAVASFYAFLIRGGRQIVCPVKPKRHYLREPQRLPRPVNEQDLRKFFEAIRDVRDHAMFTLMLRCGLRIGEVSNLKMSDLFLGESPSRMIIYGKGARERTVYLSPEAEGHLQNWLTHRPKVKDEHVFLSYQMKRLSTTSINVRVNHVRKASGVKLTAHRLRHTFADHLLSAGMPITSIQKLMGHRFVETTQNYALANDKQVQSDFYKACEKIEGWTLLTEATQVEGAALSVSKSQNYEAGWDEEANERNEDMNPINVETPERYSRLPLKLVQQLEMYRQLKVNHWRVERVIANSRLFFSLHGILWEFLYGTCSVKTVEDLRLEHVMQFVKMRLDVGISARTVNHSLSALRSFLSFLQEDEVEVHSSLENIQRLKEAERLPRYMTWEQVQRLQKEIEANVMIAKDKDVRQVALLTRAIFYLMWQGGLRTGEVELLRFSDFYISVANQAKRLFIRDGKWRKGRAVYLTDAALEALKTYLTVRERKPVGGFVFVYRGEQLRRGFLCQQLKKIGRRVDVNVTPHHLRHTFATQLLNVGCRVTSIQKLLGHSNLNTTMTYARAFDHTVMSDYFRAINTIEAEPEGVWYGLDDF